MFLFNNLINRAGKTLVNCDNFTIESPFFSFANVQKNILAQQLVQKICVIIILHALTVNERKFWYITENRYFSVNVIAFIIVQYQLKLGTFLCGFHIVSTRGGGAVINKEFFSLQSDRLQFYKICSLSMQHLKDKHLLTCLTAISNLLRMSFDWYKFSDIDGYRILSSLIFITSSQYLVVIRDTCWKIMRFIVRFGFRQVSSHAVGCKLHF